MVKARHKKSGSAGENGLVEFAVVIIAHAFGAGPD